jgi:hypothetical protein
MAIGFKAPALSKQPIALFGRGCGSGSNHHRYGEVKTRLTIGASSDFDRFVGCKVALGG